MAQARGLKKLPQYAFCNGCIDETFVRTGPLLVELGFGNGVALAEFAREHTGWNCLGVEVFQPGIGALINLCEAYALSNVRIVEGEGLTTLDSLPDESVDLLWVLFPDPWPKNRHRKRRLVTAEFGTLAATKLSPSGKLQIATDWQPYADEMHSVFERIPTLEGGIVEALLRRRTKYEERGLRLGHAVTEFEYRRT